MAQAAPLTARQGEILKLIRDLTESSGFPPTRAEIAEKMGFRSVNAAEQHLRALERKGALEILQGASRGLRVREKAGARMGRLMDLPVVGRVAAGSPMLAEEHLQGRFQVDPNLFTPRADYLLRVRGMSMRDAGILEGDLLAVHRTQEARSGQVVVARLADEVTVKRFPAARAQGAAAARESRVQAHRGRPAPRAPGHRGRCCRGNPARPRAVAAPGARSARRCSRYNRGRVRPVMTSNSATPEQLANAPATPARPADPGSRADPQRVLADRVEQLYSQMPLGMLANLLIGGIATYELWDERSRDLVLFWWGLVLLVTAARAVLYFGNRASKDRIGESEQWMRWLAISALANGVTWGFAGAVFFPSHTDEQQVFLAFLLAGVASSGIPAYAASWPMFAMYAGVIVLPFIYVLANFGNRLFTEIAFLVPIFYFINVAIAYRLNRVFLSGYRLRHAYDRLTEDHTGLNKQLEHQIEDLLEARQEVEASGRKLALFAERAPISVIEMDAKSTILEMNPAAEHMLGYSNLELIGRSALNTLFPTDERTITREWWAQFVVGRVPADRIRARCLRRDGLEVDCEFTITPLVNEANDLVSIIAQCQDITQQLEAERLKKEFTATLSHELRTPLTSIIGSLQLVNSGVLGNVEGEVLELATVAERNAQRLLDLINDLLDIDKIESGKFTLAPENVHLSELVQESLILNKSYADRFGVGLEVRGTVPEVRLHVDRKRLMQVMTNLLSNAAKFSPEGSAVEVSTRRANGIVRVEISDRGPGIPDDFRSRIFTRFAQADSTTTRHKGGTGLGLAICKRLIELMNGQIGFEERPGGGTIFHFELPVLVDVIAG